MNTISYGANFTSCAIDCTGTTSQGVKWVINNVNNSSTGTSNNFSATTNTGSYFTNPWYANYGIILQCQTLSAYTQSGYFYHSYWNYNTLPFSSSTSPLYSYSAQTCQPYGETDTTGEKQYLFDYSIRLVNDYSKDFEIWGKTLTNGVRSGSETLALRYSGGTFVYTDPNFVIT